MTPRARRITLEVALVVIGFTLLAILITWPAAAHANSILPTQGIPWDPAGFTWDLWQRLQDGLPLFGTGSTDLVAPFTIQYPAAFNLVQLAFYGPAVAIAAVSTPVFAMNVMIIAGIAFSGMAMYALARWLGCGPGVSTWAGATLAIAPYVVGKAVVHAPLVDVACFPLLVLTCLWWNENPSWKRALAVTGAFAFAWTTTAYYGVTAMVIVVVLCGWGLISIRRRRSWQHALTRGGALAALLAVLVLLPIAISALSSSAPTPARSDAEIALFSARLSDYVVPPKGAFFASGVDGAWTGQAGAGGEQAILYLGISTIIIALIGMVVAWWRPAWLGTARAVLAARIAAPLAVLLAWFSLGWPYEIVGVPIPVPSRAIWAAANEFRAFARFGVALMVVLIMVGALVIAAIARRGGPLWRNSVIATALLVTATDLATSLPVTTTPPAMPDGRAPAEWAPWTLLREQPTAGGVVEYPTGPWRNSPELEQIRHIWQVGQMIHGRPLLNGFTPMGQQVDTRSVDLARQVGDPLLPGTAQDLATAGITFATINPWAYDQYQQGAAPDAAKAPPGFAVAARFAKGVAVWRVTAASAPALAVFRQPGFGAAQAAGGRTWNPIAMPLATVTTWAPQRRVVTLTFPIRLAPGAMVSAQVRGAPAATISQAAGKIRVTLRTGPQGRAIAFTSTGPAGSLVGRPAVTT